MMTKRQSWALFCGTGLDVRNAILSKNAASSLIDRMKNGENIIADLQSAGATGTPKIKRDYAAIFAEAHKAGMAAGQSVNPTPMGVTDGTQNWVVSEGVCGFAWVKTNGNSGFGRWLMQNGGSKSYPSGVCYWVKEFGQSMARKEAFARAFADVLHKHEIKAIADSRMD